MSKPSPQSIALHKAAARLLRAARRGDGRAGSGPAQTSALGALVEWGPMSVAQLAAREGVSHATMSRMLAALEDAGAVRKQADPADARRQIVRLTRKGRAIHGAAYARRQRMIDTLVAMLRPETVDDLVAVLSLMAQRTTRG
jgi:DNA-binding MarR family transcriptional regulator